MNGKDDNTLKPGEYDIPSTIEDGEKNIIARLNLINLTQDLHMIRWLATCEPHKSEHFNDIILYTEKIINRIDKAIIQAGGELIDRRIKERRAEEEQPPVERRKDNRRKNNEGRRNRL